MNGTVFAVSIVSLTISDYNKNGAIKMNIHKDCPKYVKENDMCLIYFQLGYFNVSENYPEDCLDHIAYAEQDKVIRQ